MTVGFAVWYRGTLMKPTYIHLRAGWPQLRWDEATLAVPLAETRHVQGRLLGRMEALGFPLCGEADLSIMTDEVVKSSAIEGETLDSRQVRSSLARRLGIDIGGTVPSSRSVDGVVEMMLDATRHYAQPLTDERLFGWHAALFPSGRSGLRRITTGAWRRSEAGPMQVVSGALGRETVHFEAPAAERLEREMGTFLTWFNASPSTDPVLHSGLAHFRFVTIHPFEDGNGRIARAIADLALARSDGRAERFYSMSAQIEAERNAYYEILEQSQRGSLDVTPWLAWFLGCLKRSIARAEIALQAVLAKAAMWRLLEGRPINDRQKKVLNRLHENFEGFLTSSKYSKMADCSADTALRDVRELIDWGVLVRNESGGRSVSYRLSDQP